MIYVPPDLHHAMRTAALDLERSASDVYEEAAQSFLARRDAGTDGASEQAPHPTARSVTMDDLAAAVARLGHRIDDTLERVAAGPPSPPQQASRMAGTKAADAMRTLLGILRNAGPAGLSSGDLSTAMYGAQVRSGAAETAKAVLRGAGLVRCERRRWFVDGG